MIRVNRGKKIIVILAVTLLTTIGLSHRFISDELDIDYETEVTEENMDAEEAAATEEVTEETAAAEEAAAPTDATEENIATEEAAAAEEVTEEAAANEEATTQESDEVEFEDEVETETAMPEQTEGVLAELSITALSSLLSSEAVVYSYSELKTALENNNGITTVYFGDNITLQSTGVKINSNKANVIIDGFNPLEPGQSQPYTLTDLGTSSFTDTIYINAAGVQTLHVRDLTIIGKNYYGPFSVQDSSSLAGTVVTYERVNYNGPQLIYHRNGTIHIKDCTVSIHGGNGGSSSNEFSEAKHLIFEGVNTIDTATSSNSIFWQPGGGTFKLADDSSLVVISPNTSSTYGVFYADASSNKIDISIGERAVLEMTISGIVAPASYVTLSSFTVREGGAFYLRTTKAATSSVLRIGGALTVEKDAKFIISGFGGASYALIRQESGDITVEEDATFQIIADSAYMALLNLIGRAFICNDPANVLLYNENRDILASTTAGRVYVNAQQVNYWNKLSAGGLDNLPLYKWSKADKTNLLLDGTLDKDSSGDFSSISSNYVTGDSPGYAPSAATFSMVNARVLAFGQLDLTVTTPTINSTAISGVTAPGATVRASFTQQGTKYTPQDVTADSAGIFRIPISVTLNEATVITVESSWQYLTAAAEAVVSGEGKLEFLVPDFLEFFITELTSSTKTVTRLNPNWEIVVSDTREAASGWSLYARLNSEMTPDSEDLPALDGALVYIDELGNTVVMSTDSDILVLEHTSADSEEVFPVVWDEDEGILLNIKPGAAFADTVYSGSISWTLVDAP